MNDDYADRTDAADHARVAALRAAFAPRQHPKPIEAWMVDEWKRLGHPDVFIARTRLHAYIDQCFAELERWLHISIAAEQARLEGKSYTRSLAQLKRWRDPHIGMPITIHTKEQPCDY